MDELNDRAREHIEAPRRRIAKGIGGGYQTDTVTYWNPAGLVVYRSYANSGGGVSVFGPTEPLPDVPRHRRADLKWQLGTLGNCTEASAIGRM